MKKINNYHQLYYHVTWSTKERLPFIDPELRNPLHNYLKGKVIEMGGIAFAAGGIEEHVHVCLTIPPHISVATFIGKLKGASAHWVNHVQRPNADFVWQEGYGVFTLSKSALDPVVEYIENQENHHHYKTIQADWEI